MKMFLIGITLITIFAATTAQAETKSTSETQALNTVCANTVIIRVDGLVCDFCARALEKVFSRRDEVDAIKVDLNAGNVLVIMKPGQMMDDDTFTQLIADSGYNIRAIEKGCQP